MKGNERTINTKHGERHGCEQKGGAKRIKAGSANKSPGTFQSGLKKVGKRNGRRSWSDGPKSESQSGHEELLSEASTILVAEDNKVNQLVLRTMLEREGHHVLVAGTGKEVIQIFEQNSVDIILMDIQMPGMDGLEATTAIRGLEAGNDHIPIIALTGSTNANDRESCEKAGMDGHLSKPIQKHKLLKTINEALL